MGMKGEREQGLGRGGERKEKGTRMEKGEGGREDGAWGEKGGKGNGGDKSTAWSSQDLGSTADTLPLHYRATQLDPSKLCIIISYHLQGCE